jgi:hypothetical protein
MIDAYSMEILTHEVQAERFADAEGPCVRHQIQPHAPHAVRKSMLVLAMPG